ncbi:MAG: uroporphyrinogen-III synthase [Prevotella sp.]|nr:uroporphyrinogen-III synthase [Bacteroides sp.]MCM1365712.1 uroporphyrinogen-III synthase [Prevotella sp.]MCM1436382.1 uroporphyrinogen-III synthase [Prevotella sp.]
MKIKKVLVSQPKPTTDKSPYFSIADNHHIEVVFRPFIKVEGLTAKEFRQSKINLADFTAVILSSRTAVDHFFRLCEESRIHIPDTFKYFCTTEAVALYLQKYIVYRKRKIFFGKTGKLDDPQLVAAMTKHRKEKMIYPVSDANHEDLSILDDAGYDYTKATMYRTVSNDFAPDEPFDYDVLLFFSPIGIESLKKNFPDFDQTKQEIAIGCFGQPTVQAAKDAGLRVDIVAPSPEFPSMTSALDAFLTANEKKK